MLGDFADVEVDGVEAEEVVMEESFARQVSAGKLIMREAGAGLITLAQAFPITIGANIGTTTTAILASMATGNVSAIIIAFAHFLFNLTGTVAIYPIPLFRKIPIYLAESLGDLAAEKRGYAFLYVVGLFFMVPGLLIFISRCFK